MFDLFLFSPPKVIRVVAIDPGSFKCGYCEMLIDFQTREILSVTANTIKVESLRDDTGLWDDLISPATQRYYKLRNELIRRFEAFQPHYVVYEGPFMNKFQPSAYGPLVSLMTVAHDAVMHYNLSVPFITFQPQVVKKSVGIAGKKGKEVVIAALRKVEAITAVLQVDLDSLDDNGVDSIAVGYTFFVEDILPGGKENQMKSKSKKPKKVTPCLNSPK